MELATPPSPWRPRAILLGLLLLAATLRVVGLDFGLPYPYASKDESIVTDRAIRFADGDLNPHYFAYPTFYFYQQGLVFEGVARLGVWSGRWPDVEAGRRAYYVDPSAHFLAARGWTVMQGLLAVVLVFALGRRVGRELRLEGARAETLGLVAAALLAVNPLHAHISKFVELDVPLSLLATGCVLACLHHRDGGRWRSLLLAAALGGLGASTKYYGALLCLPIAWVVAQRVLAGRSRLGPGLARLGVAAVVMIASFLATSPYVVLDHETFRREFEFLFSHMEGGHYGQELPRNGFLVYLEYLWDPWGGVVTCGALVAGLIAVATRVLRPGTAALLLLFPAVFYVMLARMRIHFPGYLAVILPLLCVTAAVGVMSVASVLSRLLPRSSSRRRWSPGLVAALLLTTTAPQTWQAWRRGIEATRTDTRVLLHDWAVENVADGSAFATETWLHLPLNEECLRRMLRTFEAGERDREARARGEEAPYSASIPLAEKRRHGDWQRPHLKAQLAAAEDRSGPAFDLVQLSPTHMDPKNLPVMAAAGIRYVVASASRFRPLLDNPDLAQVQEERPMYRKLAGFYRRLLQGDLVVARFPGPGQEASGPELVVCDLSRLPR